MEKLLASLILFNILNLEGRCQLVSHYNFNHYHTSNGLGSSNVRKTVQDTKGFIWVATQDGLYRFQPYQFVAYNRGLDRTHSLTGSDIRDMVLIDNILWVINSFGGIDAINTITGIVVYHLYQQNYSSLKDAAFLTVATTNNLLFIGCNKGLLCFKTKESILEPLCVNGRNGVQLDSLTINKVIIDDQSKLWLFCSNKGVGLIDLINMRTIDFYSDSLVSFYDGEALNNHTVVAGTNRGLRKYKFQDGKIISEVLPFPSVEKFATSDVYAVKKFKDHLYFSFRKYLVKLNISTGDFQTIRENRYSSEKDWTESVYSIQFDKQDNLWLGCQHGVAYSSNTTSSFISYTKSFNSFESINHAYYLYPVTDTTVITCAEDGLYTVNLISGVIKNLDRGKSHFFAFKHIDNRLIISNDDGTFVRNQGNTPISRIYPEFLSPGKIILNSLANIGDSLYVLGTQNRRGVFIWNYKAHSILNIHAHSRNISLKGDVINTVYKDHKGLVWILSDNFISIYDPYKKSIHDLKLENPITHNAYNLFFDIQHMAEKYFIASYGNGIVVLNDDFTYCTEISTQVNLANNGVYKILPYKNSLLFVTTNNGLSMVNPLTYRVKNFYYESGLSSNEFEELSGNVRNGKVFIGGVNGITIIDPSKITTNTVPPVIYFTNIHIDETANDKPQKFDTTNLDATKFTVSSNWLQANISFVGLNYANPTRVTYEYRIIERDTSWIPIGTQSFVNLIGLDPGTYTLEVKAANEDGYWSPVKQLLLTFQPKWYQTWWFKVLVVLIIAAILYAFFRYRINQIRKQHQIRKDIASDLHDDIGSSLNTVKIFTHLAKKASIKETYLNEIESSLTSAIIGLRDMLWVLNDSQDTAFELVERVRKFASPVLEASNIRLDARVEAGEYKALSKAEKKNLYLIAKESINNSIKYADCKNLFLHIHQANGKTAVSIRDDGKGFDASKQSEGNGLKNIRERARQIHYLVDISSSHGKGTTIKLTKK